MDKEILTLEEAGEAFGVSVKTFIKLLREEKVPARKIGREWRFSRSALINWLSAGDSQAYSSSEAETKEFFNEVAPIWSELISDCYDESIKNKLLKLNILRKNMTFIDLGSGDGYISRSVAPYVKKVIAVDLSREMLKELNKKAKAEKISNIETIEGDGCDISIKDSSVNIVYAGMYLHHIEKLESAVEEMFRILKPGGSVIITDFYEHDNTELQKEMHDIWPGFSKKRLAELFDSIGFEKINVTHLIDKKLKECRNEKNIPEILLLTAEK